MSALSVSHHGQPQGGLGLPESQTSAAEAAAAVANQRSRSGAPKSSVPRKSRNAPLCRRIAYVLGGIGSQWPEMGTRLLYFSKTFRDTIARLTSVLRDADPDAPVSDLVNLFATGSSWTDRRFAGIGICAYQIGVINMLRDECGLRPDYVIGHSLGETAAGYAAGLQTEKETILIQWVRSRLIRKVRTRQHLLSTRRRIEGLEEVIPPSSDGRYLYYIFDPAELKVDLLEGDTLFDLNGQMSVVGLPEGEIEAAIQHLGVGSQVRVACLNSPRGQTVSGPAAQMAVLRNHLEQNSSATAKSSGAGSGVAAGARGGGERKHNDRNKVARGGLFWRDVDTDGVAYHAPFFNCFYDWLVSEFRKVLGSPGASCLREKGWISTSCADPSSVSLDAQYHARNVVNSVKFQRAVESLPSDVLVVEVGSSRSLLSQVSRSIPSVQTLGFVAVGHKEDESIYLDSTGVRLALWNAGYIGAFGMHGGVESVVNCGEGSEREDAWKLVSCAANCVRGWDSDSFSKCFEKEESPQKVAQALETCVRAARPREHIALHTLRRAFCCCARDPNRNVPQLRGFLRALSQKDSEAGKVAGGLLLLFS